MEKTQLRGALNEEGIQMKNKYADSLRQLVVLVLLSGTACAWALAMQAGAIEPVWGWWRIGVLCAVLMTTYLLIVGQNDQFVWTLLILTPVVTVSLALLWFCLQSLYAWQVVLPGARFLTATLRTVTASEGFLLVFSVYLLLRRNA